MRRHRFSKGIRSHRPRGQAMTETVTLTFFMLFWGASMMYFFPDSLNRRSNLVDVDYYIAMGGRAYGSVAQIAPASSVWEELSEKFRLLVDLLNEVSERTLASTNAGLVRLYEKWMKTGSTRMHGMLVKQGVVSPPKGFVQ